jgi:probable HAF family extracellular repeat protein
VYVNPFLWDGTKMINLIAPPFVGIPSGEAQWINEAGEVVGGAAIPGPCSEFNFHAFLWEKGAITDLGLIAAGIPNSSASFINSKTQVVGVSVPCDFSSSTAFLWEKGSMADLNTLIPPNSPFQLFSASFIDDHGVIGAFGALANGDMHALLLTPCDEHHPGLEGCDYSMVDAPVAPRVSPAPASQHPAALTPGGRLPVGMLNRFRFPWSQRNPTAGAAPAPDQERELPADGVGEHKMPDSLVEPPLWPPAGHCVGTSKLTGYCVIETPYGCFDKHDPQACPPGAKVKKPGRQFCCIHGNCGHANVDLARRCG